MKPAPRVADAPASAPNLLVQLALAIAAGVGTFMSFPYSTEPDTNVWPLAWVSFVPLFLALRAVTPRRAFWLGSLMGFVTNFGGFWWVSGVVRDFGHMPEAVAWPVAGVNAFYQGLAFALFAWLHVRLRPRSEAVSIFATAALFTVIEFLYPLLFPWYLGNGQYRFLPAIQVADVTGVMGITFTMVLVNAALYRALAARLSGLAFPRREVLAAALWTAAVFAYGVVRIGQVDDAIAAADKLALGLVEADIGIWEKEAKGMGQRDQALTLHKNLLAHQQMSRELAARGAELIVWPESSYFPLDDPFIKRDDRFALGLTREGALLAWRHHPDAAAGAGADREPFAWGIDAPRVGDGGGRLFALAAEREDAWAAVGAGGRVVFGDRRGARPVPSGAVVDLLAVDVATTAGFLPHADGADVVLWAAGADGTLVTGHPDGLAPVETDTRATLRGVALFDGRQGFAVGDGGAVVALDRRLAKRVDVGTRADLHAVWARREGPQAVAVGQGGVALARGESEAWTLEPTPTEATLRHVVGNADGSLVLAAGDGGAMVRRVGGRWTREDFPSRADVTALALDAREVPLAADATGALFARDPKGRWQALRADGLGVVTALAPLPYVKAQPLPRDVRYVWQSRAPLPALADFEAEPTTEFRGVSSADRNAVQRGFTTPILFGGITWEPPAGDAKHQTKYNTAVLLDAFGRVGGTYDKVYLLAFGEYIPFGETFPELYTMLPETGRFTPGREVRAFPWGRDKRLGVMICYEDILAKFTGQLADKDPNIIINVTNDAWFGRTSEPYLHLALSIFRAVETRLVLARSTNTGVSAIVDPVGRIVAQTRLDDAETVLERVPLMDGGTVYGRVGDLFAWALLAFVVVHGAIVRRRERASGGAPPPKAKRTASR